MQKYCVYISILVLTVFSLQSTCCGYRKGLFPHPSSLPCSLSNSTIFNCIPTPLVFMSFGPSTSSLPFLLLLAFFMQCEKPQKNPACVTEPPVCHMSALKVYLFVLLCLSPASNRLQSFLNKMKSPTIHGNHPACCLMMGMKCH